ncbi:hypothetical protein RJT34_19051 [Clitoria ternatea]|uniref:J domain-containing protein n=1 Tax=Clitoria ternatea TaxID=43366 RepID=A0AAN9IQJ1_CLITE
MHAGDFAGAMKFALKAQRLFPEIQNIVQILTVCEVHCAAQNKLSGSDLDWYAILQVQQISDEAAIKKQYRKLALLLHPDKNKSAGAEAAFKLIGEANRVLSDQTKRASFDLRFRVNVGSAAPKVSPRPPNGSSSGTKHDDTSVRNYQNNFYSQSHAWNSHHRVEPQTFWTSCPHCSTRYQYYKTILNATLRCQQCTKSFTAHNAASSCTNPKEPPKHAPPKGASKSNDGKPFAASVAKSTTGVGMSKPPTSKAKESRSTNVGSKRARQSASDLRDDNKAGNGQYMNGTNYPENNGSSKRPRQHGSFTATEAERRQVPSKAGLFNKNAGVGHQNGDMRNEASAPPEEAPLRSKTKAEQTNVQRKEASSSDLNDRKSKAGNCSPPKSNSAPRSEICIPDPDFSDFDKDKAEDCFAVGQLWAIFDNDGAMPRYYAFVKKVYSPFKLQITWLEADPGDKCEIDWHEAGLPVGCGKFKLGHSQRTTERFMFSHQVDFIKGSDRGTFMIYPKKGETWAIFRDWDIGWSSNPEKHSEYQFEFVEVQSDFDENVGIEVVYLVKVKGFVSLFQQTMQNRISLFCVPPNELYRFSHQIPSYKMTGNERAGVPKGSVELDPASLPIGLFEVDDHGDVKMENGMLNNGVNYSCQSKVEEAMSNDVILKAKSRESNDAERVSSTFRRSPRSSQKGMDNGQTSTSQYIVREDDRNNGHRDYSQPVGTAANEKVKTPQKHGKDNHERETLKVRRSPRDLSKTNAQGDAVECTAGKVMDNHSNDGKNVKSNNIPRSVGSIRACLKEDSRVVGAPSYGFKKEKSEEMFQCGQIWAIYGDKDNMPDTYALIKKIEPTPNFRLHVSILESCSPPKDVKRTISCGTFRVNKAKSQVLSLSGVSHQLKVGLMADNRCEIYPRKGEIWAVYKDLNYELTSVQRRGECHVVEVLEDSDKSIQVVILTPLSSSKPIFKAPRIQRSKTGVIEILREEVGRFSHQIPAFQHRGEENANLRGCWELDPSSVPGFTSK